MRTSRNKLLAGILYGNLPGYIRVPEPARRTAGDSLSHMHPYSLGYGLTPIHADASRVGYCTVKPHRTRSVDMNRRNFLAVGAFSGAAMAFGMPAPAIAVLGTHKVVLNPGERKSVTFSLRSAGYLVHANVTSNSLTAFPYCYTTVVWPDGSSQDWNLGASPETQHYTGTGPACGNMTFDMEACPIGNGPIEVVISVTPTSTAPSSHRWMATTNKPMNTYPLGSSFPPAGKIIRVRTPLLSPGVVAVRYVPLYNGKVSLKAICRETSAGVLFLTSLDPRKGSKPYYRSNIKDGIDASVTLPTSPSLLSLWNDTQEHISFSADIMA